jgi:hypothetical protein
MKTLRAFLQHHLNTLHVYCRLSRIVIRQRAPHWARIWEGCTIYRVLYQIRSEAV